MTDARNARSTDPATSLAGTEGIGSSHLAVLTGFLRRFDRPQGWTTGEIRDALGLGHPAIWRRMSDAHRDGLAEYVPGPDGPVTRTDHATGRAQHAHRAVLARRTDWDALWRMAE